MTSLRKVTARQEPPGEGDSEGESQSVVCRVIHLSMETLRNVSLIGLFSIVLTVTPLVMAIAYAARPSERRLALMRPLSLAGLFAALTGTALGFINVLVGLGTRGFTAETYTISAIGSAEALVPLFLGFANLTVAWLLIASGMGRQRD